MPWRKGNRLRTIPEKDADPATRLIYREIQGALALPGLQLYYPALGAYPRFLELHWQTVRGIAAGRELRSAAECLRADAYTRVHNYFRIPDLQSAARRSHTIDDPAPLLTIANYFHYADPLILLLFSYQLQALEGPTGKPRDRSLDLPDNEVCTSRGQVVQQLPPSVSEKEAPASLKKKYDAIRRTLGTPFISPEFCAFASRPEFFNAYWDILKPIFASPLYPECKYGLHSSAWSLAGQLPGPLELTLDQMADAGLSPEDIASVARILDLFVDSLSGQLLNLAVAKIALEGGNLVAPARPARSTQKKPAA
jgi:hypothetical protein